MSVIQTETGGIRLLHSSPALDLFCTPVTSDRALNLEIQSANLSVKCISGANTDILCLFLADGRRPGMAGCCSAHPWDADVKDLVLREPDHPGRN